MHCLQVIKPVKMETEMFQVLLEHPDFKGKCNLDVGEATVNFKDRNVAEEAAQFLKDRYAMSHPGTRLKIDIFEWK